MARPKSPTYHYICASAEGSVFYAAQAKNTRSPSPDNSGMIWTLQKHAARVFTKSEKASGVSIPMGGMDDFYVQGFVQVPE